MAGDLVERKETVDGFSTPRERIEAFPTFASYCEAQDPDSLARLIWDRAHQSSVFGSYSGTVGDHALTIIDAIRKQSLEEAAQVADNYLPSTFDATAIAAAIRNMGGGENG